MSLAGAFEALWLLLWEVAGYSQDLVVRAKRQVIADHMHNSRGGYDLRFILRRTVPDRTYYCMHAYLGFLWLAC